MCQGTFGLTYKVQKKDSQRMYAMKIVPRNPGYLSKPPVNSCKARLSIKQAKSLASPFVIPLKFHFETATNRYFYVDFISAGELFRQFDKLTPIYMADRANFYIAEILCGLEYFHELGIFDVNLKPRNILLDPRGHVTISKIDLFIDELPTGITRDEYLAPELLTGQPTETKTNDFWTIGILAFKILYGYRISYDRDYLDNIDCFLPRGVNHQTTKFIKELLDPNPKTRLGAKNGIQDLIAHPLFAEIDWKRLRKKLVKPPIEPKLLVNMPGFNPEPSDSSIISTRYHESAVMSNEPWNGSTHSNSSFLPVRAFGRSQRSSDTSSEFSNDSAMGKSQRSSASSSKLSYDSAMGLSTRFERLQATERLTENLFRDMILNRVVENAAVIARREAENNGHDRDQVRERRRPFDRPAGDKGFLCSKCGSINLVVGVSGPWQERFWCSRCFKVYSRTELVSAYQNPHPPSTNDSTTSQASKTIPSDLAKAPLPRFARQSFPQPQSSGIIPASSWPPESPQHNTPKKSK